MANSIIYTGNLPCYVLYLLFDNLNVVDRNNGDIYTKPKSKFQLTVRVFSIAFVMPVIDKLTEFLNALIM